MYKILQAGILSTTALVSTVVGATNPVYGPYFAFLAGIAYLPPSNYTGFNVIFPGITKKLDYKVAFSSGLQLGYKIRNLRLEMEGNYINAGASKLQAGNIVIQNRNSDLLVLKGSNSLVGGFVNLIYEFYSPYSTWDFYPYLGFGAGYTRVRNNLKISTANIILDHDGVSQSVAAGQGIIGAGYYMDDFTTFGLDYRYMATGKLNILNDRKLNIHTVNFVLNFAFGV